MGANFWFPKSYKAQNQKLTKMKTIIVVQTTQEVEDLQKRMNKNFPKLAGEIKCDNNFESALNLIPVDGEVAVITSNYFHDKKDQLLSKEQKNGNKLAELVKRINPRAKVHIFSEDFVFPKNSFVDTFFKKTNGGANFDEDIKAAFYALGLAEVF